MWQHRAMCWDSRIKKESLFRLSCDPDGIRTHDRLLRRQMLYPAELPDPAAHLVVEVSAAQR